MTDSDYDMIRFNEIFHHFSAIVAIFVKSRHVSANN